MAASLKTLAIALVCAVLIAYVLAEEDEDLECDVKCRVMLDNIDHNKDMRQISHGLDWVKKLVEHENKLKPGGNDVPKND